MRIPVANQGEVRIDRIDALPDVPMRPYTQRTADGAYIISHSEQGHHHVLGGNVEVMERTEGGVVPAGASILYAIVREPTALRQDAAVPHRPVPLTPSVYEMRIKREFDPFAEAISRVAD